jgi:lipopolysaccharide transport system ATP-binding protein
MRIDGVFKRYRLGEVGVGTLLDDTWAIFAKVSGRKDPALSQTLQNDRSVAGGKYVWALENIGFNVNQGEVVGIIGRNGAGKSTLLKLLSRVTKPTQGEIRMRGRVASLLEVGTGFHPELTGRENVFLNGAILGMTRAEVRVKFDEIVDFAGVAKYIDTPIKRYSSGMKVRLGFAVSAFLEPEILIIDEVLAVGDADFQRRCIGKMDEVSKEDGRTILFVSHNMGSISQLCNRGIILQNGKMVFDGGTDAAIDAYLKLGESNQNPVTPKDKQNDLFKIVSLGFTNSKGEYVGSIDITEAGTIRVSFEAFQYLENVRINLKVSRREQLIFFTRQSDDLPQVDFDKGIHTFQFLLDPLSLVAGEYSVSLVIAYPSGKLGKQQRLFLENALSFTIEELSMDMSQKGFARDRGGLVVAQGQWKFLG